METNNFTKINPDNLMMGDIIAMYPYHTPQVITRFSTEVIDHPDWFHGILLTPDILYKIGFVDHHGNTDKMIYWIGRSFLEYDKLHNTLMYFKTDENNTYMKTRLYCTVFCLHELQHALKLMHIDIDIKKEMLMDIKNKND